MDDDWFDGFFTGWLIFGGSERRGPSYSRPAKHRQARRRRWWQVWRRN